MGFLESLGFWIADVACVCLSPDHLTPDVCPWIISHQGLVEVLSGATVSSYTVAVLVPARIVPHLHTLTLSTPRHFRSSIVANPSHHVEAAALFKVYSGDFWSFGKPSRVLFLLPRSRLHDSHACPPHCELAVKTTFPRFHEIAHTCTSANLPCRTLIMTMGD